MSYVISSEDFLYTFVGRFINQIKSPCGTVGRHHFLDKGFLFMTYAEKLRDPRWQKKRLEIMNRDNFTCIRCGDNKSTLNIHHKKYVNDPWDCPDMYLVTLCATCHEKETDVSNENYILKEISEKSNLLCLQLFDHLIELIHLRTIDKGEFERITKIVHDKSRPIDFNKDWY